MKSKELKQIREYWNTKYPNVEIILYEKTEDGKYFGKMMTSNYSFDFNADTIGCLISQGENFLRKVNK